LTTTIDGGEKTPILKKTIQNCYKES